MHPIPFKASLWAVPSGPVHLEGSPTPEQLELERERTQALRDAWKPTPEAWELLDRLRELTGRTVEVQPWDPMMAWMEDEAPYAIRGTCVGVLTRASGGHEQAYLLLEGVTVVATESGYDCRSRYVETIDGHDGLNLADIDSLKVELR